MICSFFILHKLYFHSVYLGNGSQTGNFGKIGVCLNKVCFECSTFDISFTVSFCLHCILCTINVDWKFGKTLSFVLYIYIYI